MTYEVREECGYHVVLLVGDVDLSCSPEARQVILDCLDRGHATLVDLSQVTYIDSSGVASLVEGFQKAKEKTLRFGLIDVSEAVMNVIELARLDKVFPIHADIRARFEADS